VDSVQEKLRGLVEWGMRRKESRVEEQGKYKITAGDSGK
jgi:hypothetical protein